MAGHRQIPKQTEGPYLEDIIEAWESPLYKGEVPTADYMLVACPINVCSDKYVIYGYIDSEDNISQMSWAGTGTVLTGGLLDIACQRWNGTRTPEDWLLAFEQVFGFPRGQGTPEREERAYLVVTAFLKTLRDNDANLYRPLSVLPQFESKPEQPRR